MSTSSGHESIIRRQTGLKLGISIGHSGHNIAAVLPAIQQAERVELDSVWVSEGWGPDSVSVMGYLAASTTRLKLASAVMQMTARVPAAAAAAALTIDALSGGRLILGLGLSGPQVTEGWHGVPFKKPIARTREYVQIIRDVIARESALRCEGQIYRIPYDAPDGLGVGKPLRTLINPLRDRIPIYLGAIGPNNVKLAAQIADGWYPAYYSPERDSTFAPDLEAGFAAAGRDPADLDVVAVVKVAIGRDIGECRDQVRGEFARVLGGYGSTERNFYMQLMRRYGLAEELLPIQEHFLAGRKKDAVAAVPDWLIDEFSLVGPPEHIRDRLEVWKTSRVSTLVLRTVDPDAVTTIAELL